MPEIAFLMGKSSSGKDNIFKALVGDKEQIGRAHV